MGFLAAFLAAGFLAAFLAAVFLAAFLALGFLALTAFFSTAASLNEPDPFLPATAADTTLLATTNLRIAWREDPILSPSPLIAAAIMVAYGGWAAGVFGLVTFLTLTSGTATVSAIISLLWVSFLLTSPM